jgi:carbon-monoxide dehydrogenase catalytic subunit
VTGAPRLVKVLTEDLPGVTGGTLAVETDPVEAVAAMLAHIEVKRTALGI